MRLGDFSQTRLRASLSGVIWTVAGMGFALTFFSGGGPEGFASDSARHLVGAVDVGLAFLAYWLVLWMTRQRDGSAPAVDERDLQTMARANQSTLIVVLVAIFLLAIGLWVAYESAEVVPVGWMWFLAYGSVILASITSSVATLILDGRTGSHG